MPCATRREPSEFAKGFTVGECRISVASRRHCRFGPWTYRHRQAATRMTIGIGIIGTGKHGERYLRHVAEVPGLRLAALCRRDRARGEEQARGSGCRFHAEPDALLAD